VNDCFQPVSRYQGYASIGALSRSLGNEGFGARDLEDFRDALVAARAMERTVVVHVPADRYEGVPSCECWWDVPVAEVAEVSETESVQEARAAYERSGAHRRWYVAPSEDRR
jgi:3D-(3,5/4)-trihydroxycyclohexane-1,2-dione acylhydrolase (decyclizing)